jgi:hypothetical protein
LHGIHAGLKECAKVKGFKAVLLRNDLLKKVKQCDANLSFILQVYQVCWMYHYPFRSFKPFLQAKLCSFLLLPQLTRQFNRLDLPEKEVDGG